MNYYSSRLVDIPDEPVGENPSFERDRNLNYIVKPEWKPSILDTCYMVPQGVGDILRYISSTATCNLFNLNIIIMNIMVYC